MYLQGHSDAVKYMDKTSSREERTPMKLRFTKMHGCGNDYVYVNCMEKMLDKPEEIAKIVSHRRFGVGSDGLICICPSDKADFRMRMYNADGSEGKMCGNGSRCIAKYVYDKGLTDKTDFTLETLAGIKTIHVTVKNGKVELAEVDMDKAITDPQQVPVKWDGKELVDAPLEFTTKDSRTFPVWGTAVSMGNPHFVTFVENVDTAPVEEAGNIIEHSPYFPERVNVEFVQVLGPNHVKFRVWERGSGETWACGTGACAVAYASVRLEKAGKRNEFLNVDVKGGRLQVKILDDDRTILKGPAVTVFEGEMEIPDSL